MHSVIIGNGVAGITAAFELRRRDSKARVTVISGESDYFFSRTALMYTYMDRLSLRELEPYERPVYDKHGIQRVRGWVNDLDANRHTVRLESGKEISYDRLLLATGSVPNLLDWPGLAGAREGVVHFVSLQHLQECERVTPSTRQALVVGGGLIGVELVECLVHHGLEVTFLVREPWYWPVALGAEEGAMISAHIQAHGVRVLHQEEVADVLSGPDGRVRAVRSNKGNEYGCQMLGITIGVRPAIDWLKSVTTPPALGRGISVAPDFRTSLTDVWAAGDCAEFSGAGRRPVVEQIWYSAKRQGALVARSMLGDPTEYRPPLFYNSARFFEIEYTTVGDVVRLPEDARSFYYRVPGKEVSLRVVERNGAVIGFNMLGSRWDHVFFERWVAERRSIDYVIEHLREAQFDVEFGVVDLSAVTGEYQRWRRSAAA